MNLAINAITIGGGKGWPQVEMHR